MESSTGLKKRLGIISYIAVFLAVEMIFGYFILESRRLFWESSMEHGSYLAQAQMEKIEFSFLDNNPSNFISKGSSTWSGS